VRDQVAAGIACAGAEIDHEIGAANGVFIVLDDEYGVAKIAELFEGAEKAVVVSGVQANGRFVEHVEDAPQAGADLGSETDALGFATGERGAETTEAEIAEADREEEVQALGDFFKRAAGDFALTGS